MKTAERHQLVLEDIFFQLTWLKMQADSIDAGLLSYMLDMAIVKRVSSYA